MFSMRITSFLILLMKITVICASGKEGRLITEEALKRGHEVTAIVRNKSKISDLKVNHVIEKDILKITYEDVSNSEVVVDAFGAWTPETLPQHSTTLNHLCDILKGKKQRLIVVGGAGSLFTDKSHKQRVFQSEGFPDAFVPLATAMFKAFEELTKRNDVNWTYLSPACDFDANGKRSGKYTLGGDEVILNGSGKSYVSYADYAIAIVDEAEKNKYLHKRFTVVSE